ncbi:SCO1431 family membrane protein [Streptomyces sp. NPDC052052]|uniref:SCO1431 family membrane protein n=1 Tax=Streptomyces sp. NPDC052052 TaxID=3154756 RepID=UPI003421B874
MTATAARTSATFFAAHRRAGTGGPKDDSKLLETVLGWTLVVVVAMFVTRAGLM